METKHLARRFWILAGALLVMGSGFAADQTRTERVQFKRGSNSATVESRIKGYESVDYLLGARAGQHMNVSMTTKHGATYFNILAPGETEVAMFNGSMNDNRFEGTLPANGDYKIRVYMMRSAARRNEVAPFRLKMAIGSPGQQTQRPPSGDVLVPGTNFHATGQLPCSAGGGQPTGQCNFGVRREGGGNANVTITGPDGRQRVIFFKNGNPVGYDKSQADRSPLQAHKQSDLNIIRIGEERYEVSDAIVQGG
ncbi:hypothetical protein [Massilia soli]|uniref:Inhibitor of g-type lysozyme n=1 Tax=Massilia soli TaxID=2792854 RepID=A0ABS7SVS9_9BURK|nr:hypothetical protein [Massilia soli]MBZ2210029.1 hypothetical protein [Massilia soli]